MSDNKMKYLKDYKQPDYWVRHVDLTFDLKEGETVVTSKLTVEKNGEHNRPLVLDGEDLDLVSVTMDDAPMAKGDDISSGYIIDDKTLSLQPCDDNFTIETVVKAIPESNTELKGLYRSSGNWCTQCEPEGFRKITYSVDRPDNMATYNVTLIADEEAAPVLLSNGNLVDQGKSDDNRHYTVWSDPFPKPSYLFALVGGDLSFIEDNFETMSGRNVTLRVYADQKDLGKLDHAMQSLKKSMKWDEEVYGREYELDLFNIVAVDDFNSGAMENTSLNIFNTKYVLADPDTATDAEYAAVEAVVAHEYFHNWTGNRVTCRDWYQLCLKEGLTVFRDQEFSADMGSRSVKRINDVIDLRAAQFPEDIGPMVHPPRPNKFENIDNFYTCTVYEKGAELNRMLRHVLGEENFRKGSDLYFERHDGQAVTVEDWVGALSDASNQDLNQFMWWYTQAGTPTVTASWKHYPEVNEFYLMLEQNVPKIEGKSDGFPRHMPVKFGLIDADGNEVLSEMLELTEDRRNYVFENIPEGCVPSLFRDFSAPINLNATYTDDELQHLMVHDTDGFNQWDAGNQFLKTKMLECIATYKEGTPVAVSDDVVAVLKGILEKPDMDLQLKSLALTIPGYSELSLAQDVIDPHAIKAVRKAFLTKIGTDLQSDFLTSYQEHYKPEKEYTLDDAGRREIQNISLSYLSHSGSEAASALALAQYEGANNITDRGAAFSIMMNMDSGVVDKPAVTQSFYDRNKDNALVMNKWVASQVGGSVSNALEVAQDLESHDLLKSKNPNMLRSLYHGFTGNTGAFHATDGSGYKLLSDAVMEIDKTNTQLAAGLVSVFERFRKYTPDLQGKMETELHRIASSEIVSDGLGEKLSAFLGKDIYSQLRSDAGSKVELHIT